jgi:hypothetical protein
VDKFSFKIRRFKSTSKSFPAIPAAMSTGPRFFLQRAFGRKPKQPLTPALVYSNIPLPDTKISLLRLARLWKKIALLK